MIIRPEEPRDHPAVHAINAEAFEGPAEADLVDRLRREASPIVSLVAESEGAVVGHILFSPVSLEGYANANLMGLAPIAVSLLEQRKGVGSELVRAGLQLCVKEQVEAVVVLGHPQYYSRFGFVPASRLGLGCEYEVPDDVFLAMELQSGSLDGRMGLVKYHSAFGGV